MFCQRDNRITLCPQGSDQRICIGACLLYTSRPAVTAVAVMGLNVTIVCMMNFVDAWALRLILYLIHISQKAAELHITELVFMDNDGEKLRIYGGLAAHVSRMLNPELKRCV